MQKIQDINFGLWLLLKRTTNVVEKSRIKEQVKNRIWRQGVDILEMATRLGDQATQNAIVNETILERSSISAKLSRMERDGIIKRYRDLNRKNAVRIEVTEKGKRIYRDSLYRESIDSVFSSLTEEEKLDLWRILSKIRVKALGDLGITKASLYPPPDPSEY